MLGWVLLLLSIFLYFSRRWKYISYFLYIGFLLDGYGILITPLLGGVKNADLALIYTAIVSVVMICNKRYSLPADAVFRWYYFFIAFLICSVLFSYVHYAIPIYNIIQGGRLFLLVLSLPILVNMSQENVGKLIRVFSTMTIIVGIIDLTQIVLQIPILPSYSIMVDSSTGLYRFFNYPKFTTFFLLVCIVCPDYYGKRTKYIIAMLVVCILGSLGRSAMLITLMSVFLLLYFSGKTSKIVKYVLMILFIALPLFPVIIERFSDGGGGTLSDIHSVISGNVEMVDYTQTEGSFTYRISWLLERFVYLIDCPFSEQFFGLGLISDGSELSRRMYHFVVNIIFYESDMVQQLRSPDIAYGTMLAYLGFGGTIIYMVFYCKMMMAFFREKSKNPYFLVIVVLMITGLGSSLFNDALSNPSSFALHFMLLGILFKNTRLSKQ